MAKHWKEPLDARRHLDHFHVGNAHRRCAERSGMGVSYFVEVCGFTFEFANTDQIAEMIAFLAMPIHPSSRRPVFDPEKGEWQAWHERLPARILKRSKRERVLRALRDAYDAFAARAGP